MQTVYHIVLHQGIQEQEAVRQLIGRSCAALFYHPAQLQSSSD
jgi:hypothetical protein